MHNGVHNRVVNGAGPGRNGQIRSGGRWRIIDQSHCQTYKKPEKLTVGLGGIEPPTSALSVRANGLVK